MNVTRKFLIAAAVQIKFVGFLLNLSMVRGSAVVIRVHGLELVPDSRYGRTNTYIDN